jgi:hypothetical protein
MEEMEATMGRLSGERRVRLSPTMIRRLWEIKRERGLSLDQFKIALCCPFTSQTLYNAMKGAPLWESNYTFLAEFVRKHTPASAERDGKAASAGDDGDIEETAGAVRTVRGSR